MREAVEARQNNIFGIKRDKKIVKTSKTSKPTSCELRGYHLICIWGSLVKFQGDGVVVKTLPSVKCRFAEFLYLGLPMSFKAQCLPQIKGGLSLAGCHVVAQTQGYHLVCIWGSLVKFQGGGVVVKTMLCARVQIC